MRNGGIGCGWFPEEDEDELRILAQDLLKERLKEIWEISNGRKKEMDSKSSL